jgi:hypothetical protein
MQLVVIAAYVKAAFMSHRNIVMKRLLLFEEITVLRNKIKK